MIVIFKNEDGGFSVRPAYIGFIKNNFIRRVLCSLFYPITIMCTLTINLLQAIFVCIFVFIRAIYFPFKNLSTPIWKTEIWKRPRTKEDKNKRMD